jgi:hypothetical protein
MNSTLPFMKGMREAFEENLFTISSKKIDAITALFLNWLNNSARLKPVPDLQVRIAGMEPKLRKMAKNLDLSFQDGKLVIKADAESESLLSLLRRGSDWFDPHPDVNAAILVALTSGSQVS